MRWDECARFGGQGRESASGIYKMNNELLRVDGATVIFSTRCVRDGLGTGMATQTREMRQSQDNVKHRKAFKKHPPLTPRHEWNARSSSPCIACVQVDGGSVRYTRKIVLPFQPICYSMMAKQSFALYVNYIWNSNVWNWHTAADHDGHSPTTDGVVCATVSPLRTTCCGCVYIFILCCGRPLPFVLCWRFAFVNSFIIPADSIGRSPHKR